MNPFQVLKNIYTMIFIFLMYKFPGRDNSSVEKFSFIKWVARIAWTLLLPLLMAFIVVKSIKRIFTQKDLEDAENASKLRLATYEELSEFEWRSEKEVYMRLLQRAIKNNDNGKTLVVPDIADVLVSLLMGENIFCSLRQETREEFVERSLKEHTELPYFQKRLIILLEKWKISQEEIDAARNELGYKEIPPHHLEKIRLMFEEQFTLIECHSKNELFKGFYLGREMMFLKINRGTTSPKKQDERRLVFER